jgi:hypothetical protein
MDCRDCPRYNTDERKCRDGKVNPQKWSMAVEIANVLGVRAVCPLNDHRERLIRCRTRNVKTTG